MITAPWQQIAFLWEIWPIEFHLGISELQTDKILWKLLLPFLRRVIFCDLDLTGVHCSNT